MVPSSSQVRVAIVTENDFRNRRRFERVGFRVAVRDTRRLEPVADRCDHVLAHAEDHGGIVPSEDLRVVCEGLEALGNPAEAERKRFVSTEGVVVLPVSLTKSPGRLRAWP